jgi:hypothetical protein
MRPTLLLPADERANKTLTLITRTIQTNTTNAKNIIELHNIINLIPDSFRPSLLKALEPIVHDYRDTLDNMKRRTITTIKNVIQEQVRVSLNIPSIMTGLLICYISRENILKWLLIADPNYIFFNRPSNETFTLTMVRDKERSPPTIMQLTENQLAGICFSLNPDLINHYNIDIEIKSSITGNYPINKIDISQHYLSYYETLQSPDGLANNPYRLDLMVSPIEDIVPLICFDNVDFLQGIFSVASWYQLSNKGHHILWGKLSEVIDDIEDYSIELRAV